MNGRAGFIVITPLLLEAGRETVIPTQAGIHPSRTAPDPGLRRDDNGAVIVQRGWIARDALQRTRLPDVATPAGVVNVQGSIAAPPSRLFEFSGPAETGPIRQNLDRVEYALETGLVLRPMSVLQADDSGSDGLLRQWPRPAFDVHKNYGYAAQWFALAALITGLYVWFQLVRPRLRARR